MQSQGSQPGLFNYLGLTSEKEENQNHDHGISKV